MKATEFLLDVLQKEGITHLFLVPGGYIDPIISALQKAPRIKAIVAAHEGGATFMADGYARASGKFGVALSIGGPGITNMITGIATAYTDEIPLFIVTGETKTYWEGRGAFQDSSVGGINDSSLLQSITVKKLSAENIQCVEPYIKQLLRSMLSHAKRGPVHLSLPADIQVQEREFQYQNVTHSLYHSRILDRHALADFWNLIRKFPKVVILAGTGCAHSETTRTLVEVAERFEIPVATTLGAKGVMPENHPLSLGVFGWFGTRKANETLLSKEIDILLVLGSKLSQMETLLWTKDLLPRHALIINDINESNFFPNYDPQLFILGDNKEFLTAILETKNNPLNQTKTKRRRWLQNYVHKIPRFYDIENLKSKSIPIHPARLLQELREVMPKETILFVGEGAHGFFATHYWTSFGPGQFFSTVKYLSPMGWSIPAAIGGKLANPNNPVVCLTGDGSILMHGLEIQTAARYNVPVIFIVFNNKAHGNPQLRGRRIGKFECNFLALPQHDWAKFGESLGAVGIRVVKPDELRRAFKKALKLNKVVVIDVLTGNYPTPTYLFDEYMYQLKSPIKRF